MKVLVGWDHTAEAETIDLFLNVDDMEAKVCTSAAEFDTAAAAGPWDVILMALNFPTSAHAYPLFQRVRQLQPDAPVLGACFQGEIVHLAKFVSHGLHTFLMRDAAGEFVLLLRSLLESAHATVVAQRARGLADRLREEIESVRRLQESVVPADLPQLNGYEVVARYEPAQIRVMGNQPVLLAGGDYYDIFSLDNRTLVLLVSDAAGHGIKACMSIMGMRTLVGMIRDRSYQDTSHFVAELNRGLCGKAAFPDDGGFITLLYCTLDTVTHRLQFTSAGHPMPFLHDRTTNKVVALGGENESGLPLGICGDEGYHTVTVDLPEKSRLLLYSDGLADAFPLEGRYCGRFGQEGIIRCLCGSAHLPLAKTVDRLFAESNAFTAGSGRHDDTSLVLVQRGG